MKPPNKPNIFALPNQTTIVFWLIVGVIAGSSLIGSMNRSPLPVWLLGIAILLLSLRSFLAYSQRELEKYQPTSSYPHLEEMVSSLSARIRLRRAPVLIVTATEKPTEPYTFGTFRNKYIVVSGSMAERWMSKLKQSDCESAVEVKLLHELYHFKTGDFWKLEYARQLLKYATLTAAWSFAFVVGFIFLLAMAGDYVLHLNIEQFLNQLTQPLPGLKETIRPLLPSQSEIADLRQKSAGINLSLVLSFGASVTLPLILSALLLWLLYLPTLRRLREFYADAGVVYQQLSDVALLQSILPFKLISPETTFRKPAHISSLRIWYTERFEFNISALREKHPKSQWRAAALKYPFVVFGSWKDITVLVGAVVLTLEILISSNPITLAYVGSLPLHFVTLVTFILTAVFLLPHIIFDRNSARSNMFKIITVIIGVRLIWLLFTIATLILLLFIAPGMLQDILASVVAGVARFAGYSEELGFPSLEGFIIQATIVNLIQIPIVFTILSAALVVFMLSVDRILTWYTFPRAEVNLMRVIYGWMTLIAILLALVALPLATRLIGLHSSFDLMALIRLFVGVGVTVIGLLFFVYCDRRYGRHCARCGRTIPGRYIPGVTQCSHCGESPHSWMLANY